MKKFSKLIAAAIVMIFVVVCTIVASASTYADYYLSFNNEYNSQNQVFNGYEGKDIKLDATGVSCKATTAKYDVSLYEQTGIFTTQLINDTQTKLSSNKSSTAWWFGNKGRTYHYNIKVYNNHLPSDGSKADLKINKVNIYNFTHTSK